MNLGQKSWVAVALVMSIGLGLGGCAKTSKPQNKSASAPVVGEANPPASNPAASQPGSGKSDQKKSDAELVGPGPSSGVKCANPVPLDTVPSSWTRVEGKDLITGKEGEYLLVQVTLHGVFTSSSGRTASASTQTIIIDRDLDDDGLNQAVTCKDMDGRERLHLYTEPMESISMVDGSYQERRRVEFFIESDDAQHSADVKSVSEKTRFGEKTEDAAATEEKLKARGIQFDTRTYRVSDKEFELRITVTMPDDAGNGTMINFNSAYRYRLKK